MLGYAPAGVAPSGLGHDAAWGKKVVDEGKLKMRALKVTKPKVERDANKATGGEVQEGSTTLISNRR